MNKKDDAYNDQKRTTGDLQSVSKTLLPFSKQLLGARGFITIDILTKWSEIVGEDMACYSWPECIDFKKGQKNNGTIFLNVVSGAFALEVQHRQNFIIDKVNTYFGYGAVSKIKIVQVSQLQENPLHNFTNPKKKTLVSLKEENYIKDLTREVSNDKLKNLLFSLGKEIYNDNHNEKK